MADFVNTIDLLGEEATAAAIIGKTITEFNDDTLVEIGERAFDSCYTLQSINLPNVITLGKESFYASLSSGGMLQSSVYLPKVQTIGQKAFYSTAITSIRLPSIITLNGYIFQYCKQLTLVELSDRVNNIPSSLFDNCSSLNVIVIRNKTVCPLVSTNAFQRTPFGTGGTGGTLYVHQEFIESYQTETNWSTLYAQGTCNFVAIEGSEYE